MSENETKDEGSVQDGGKKKKQHGGPWVPGHGPDCGKGGGIRGGNGVGRGGVHNGRSSRGGRGK